VVLSVLDSFGVINPNFDEGNGHPTVGGAMVMQSSPSGFCEARLFFFKHRLSLNRYVLHFHNIKVLYTVI
jgi:hypothetical protein